MIVLLDILLYIIAIAMSRRKWMTVGVIVAVWLLAVLFETSYGIAIGNQTAAQAMWGIPTFAFAAIGGCIHSWMTRRRIREGTA
jgi:peptidoglycan/LPS O-acetylase OafA/YrhL